MIFFFAHVVTECQTKAEFVILLMAGLKWLSKVWRAGLSADDEQRNRCSTSIFGELNESLKRVMASCAPIEASLSVALVSSSHLLAQVRSNAVPGNRGAPRSSAFSKGICRKDSNVGSVTWQPRWAISSHLETLMFRPMSCPASVTIWTSFATISWEPPRVTSSMYPKWRTEPSDSRSGWMVLQNSRGPSGLLLLLCIREQEFSYV